MKIGTLLSAEMVIVTSKVLPADSTVTDAKINERYRQYLPAHFSQPRERQAQTNSLLRELELTPTSQKYVVFGDKTLSKDDMYANQGKKLARVPGEI